MRALVFCPQSRQLGRSLASIHALDMAGHDVTLLFDCAPPRLHDERWDTVTRKYQRARRECLQGGYDALMTIEDDVIVPSDALKRLVAVGSDVAYGLNCWRYPPYHWSAVIDLQGEDRHVSLEQDRAARQAAWGSVIDVVGCGLFCTLIRRHVLAVLPFERRGQHCCDWYFALDCQAEGFTQKADLGVVCGHVVDSRTVVRPEPMTGYMLEYV